MIRSGINLLLILTAITMFTGNVMAAEPTETTKKFVRPKMLFGQPVNVNTAGGGSLPEGKLLTVINASFADKSRAVKGWKGPDVFSQVWLLKLRYGITNHLELSTTTPYVNLHRSNAPVSPKHIDGLGDQVVSLVYAPWNEHQGDLFSASVTGGVSLPTGQYGDNHIPGNGVFGWRTQIGIGKFWTPRIHTSTEVVWSGAFDRGNQEVRRGQQFQWNTNARYLFEHFDVGLESSYIAQASGNKDTPVGNVNLHNGYTELFVGPSVNVPINQLNSWVGVGVFMPVMQHTYAATAVEDARYEVKIGTLW